MILKAITKEEAESSDVDSLHHLMKMFKGKYYNLTIVDNTLILYIGKKPTRKILDKYMGRRV